MASGTVQSGWDDRPADAFTSRWWGIVSTVYLCTAPLTIVWGFWSFMFLRLLGPVAPRTAGTFEYFALGLWTFGPLLVGVLLATAIEARRTAEAPLTGARRWRRGLRIALGLLLPLGLALRLLPIAVRF